MRKHRQSAAAVRLGQVCRFQNGGTPSKTNPAYWGGDIPWITSADIQERRIEASRSTVTDEGVVHSAATKVVAGTLLLVTRTGVGKTAVAPWELSFSQDITALLPDVEQLETSYLQRFLDTQKDYFARHSRGATIKGIAREVLESLEIPLASISSQKRIAAILDAADALRAKRRESIEQLDSLIQATFLEMFGDPVTNPKGWEASTLGAVCDIQTGYAWKSKRFNSDGVGTPVIRIQNVGTSEAELIHTEEPPIGRFWVTPSELLLTLSGSFRLAKWLGPKALLNQRIARLTAKPGVNKSFVEHALASRLHAIEAMGRHALVNNVALADLREMGMFLPPLDLQTRFASIVESIEQQKARLKAHLAELDTLFASLQSRAFNGELVA